MFRWMAFLNAMRFFPRRPVKDTAEMMGVYWEEDIEDRDSPGIPEADLTEAERKEALGRMARRRGY
jgi:hypothetical protein